MLVPETVPTLPGFTLTSAYRPAQEVGGDFFQIIPLSGGGTFVVLDPDGGCTLSSAGHPAPYLITVLTLTRLGVGEASSARFTTPVFESAG